MVSSSSIISAFSSDDLFAILISVIALAGTAVSIVADGYKIKETRLHLQQEINKDNAIIKQQQTLLQIHHRKT